MRWNARGVTEAAAVEHLLSGRDLARLRTWAAAVEADPAYLPKDDGEVELDLAVILRQVCRVGLDSRRPGPAPCQVPAGQQMFHGRRLRDTTGVPTHPEITFDRSCVPERGNDFLAQRGVLTLGGYHRVDVGGGPADVNDQDIT